MEAGFGYYTGKAEDCTKDRNSNLQGWTGTENRQRGIENTVWKEVRFISYSRTGISYKGEHIICYTWDLDLPLHLNINKL